MNAAQPRCPHCGSVGRSSTYFCVVCGRRYHGPISGDLLALAARRQSASGAPVNCRHCHITVRAGARFCSGCGAALVAGAGAGVAAG